MKKLSILTAAASALMLLASCTESTISEITPTVSTTPSDGDAITFTSNVGKNKQTRAGYTGGITTDELKDEALGFGVFAYYTPKDASGNYLYHNSGDKTTKKKLTNDYASESEANFMFNQQVTWASSGYTGYIGAEGDGMWTYAPIKYWPNDFNTTDVDDQENDANNATASGSNDTGIGLGYLSFFAYAPYVDFSAGTYSSSNYKGINTVNGESAPVGTTYGITAINGKTTISSGTAADNANNAAGDPILTYKIDPNKTVDLLWGTAGKTSVNVNEVVQNQNYTVYGTPVSEVYPYVSKYPVNINLTKQKTTGVIDFAFKHALAKVGGSSTTTPASTSVPNGLMVVLDIDDMKGAETGGEKDATTLVTIKEVSIASKAFTKDAEGDEKGSRSYTNTWFVNAGATFNLATGEWGLPTGTTTTTEGSATIITHTINQSGTGASAKLNTQIAENSPSWSTGWSLDGVTTEKVNVYDEETNPFVFIPGTWPELTITVDYIVRTHDDNLKAGTSLVEQKITKKLTFTDAVEMNKQYNILMHLGLTSVKFTASVSDWDVDGTDTNSNGVIEDTEIDVEDVYLPINVSTTLRMSTSSSTIAADGGDDPTITTKLDYYDVATKTMKTNQDIVSPATLAYSISPQTDSKPVISSAGAITEVPRNTGFTNKTYTVTATYTNSSSTITETLDLTQLAEIDLTSTTITAATTSFTVTVKDNQATPAVVDLTTNVPKITIVKKVGSGAYGDALTLPTTKNDSGVITITIPANEDTSNTVTYKVTVKIGDAEKDIEVVQSAA